MRLLALRAETMQAMRRLKLPCDDITPIGLWGSDMFLIGVNNEQFEVLRLWNVQTEDITPATLRDFHTDEPAIPTTPSAGNAASDARTSAAEASSATPPKHVAPPAATLKSSPKPSAAEPSRTSARAATASPSSAPVSMATRPSALPAIDITPAMPAAVQPRAPDAPTLMRSDSAPDLGRGNGSAGTPSVSDRRDGPALTLESNVGNASRSGDESSAKRGKSLRGEPEARPAPSREKEKVQIATQDKESSAGKLRMTVDGEHLYAEIKGGKIVLKDRTYDSIAHARDSIRRERNKVAVWEYFDEGVKAWRVLNRD